MALDRFTVIDLLPFYEVLLTERQKEIMKSYFFDDLSLSEIAENLQISRNAVYDTVKKTEKTIFDYEEKLHLYDNAMFRMEIYDKLKTDLNREDKLSLIEKLIAKEEEYQYE